MRMVASWERVETMLIIDGEANVKLESCSCEDVKLVDYGL